MVLSLSLSLFSLLSPRLPLFSLFSSLLSSLSSLSLSYYTSDAIIIEASFFTVNFGGKKSIPERILQGIIFPFQRNSLSNLLIGFNI